MRNYNGCSNSWTQATERLARASTRSHTQKNAQCTLDLPETYHIQAAMLCVGRTQIGLWKW